MRSAKAEQHCYVIESVDKMHFRVLELRIIFDCAEYQLCTAAHNWYFAGRPHALGILEAIDHYDFFGSCTLPAMQSAR